MVGQNIQERYTELVHSRRKQIESARREANGQRVVAYGFTFSSGACGMGVYGALASGRTKEAIFWGLGAIVLAVLAYFDNRTANQTERQTSSIEKTMGIEEVLWEAEGARVPGKIYPPE